MIMRKLKRWGMAALSFLGTCLWIPVLIPVVLGIFFLAWLFEAMLTLAAIMRERSPSKPKPVLKGERT